MHSSSLIQLSLIILGLIAAITGAQVLMGNFIGIVVYGFGSGYDGATNSAVLTLLSAGTYFLIAWFLISKSRDWSTGIIKMTRVDPNFSIIAEPSQILFFLFICIGIYTLIKEFPVLIQKIYYEFSTKAAGLSSALDFDHSRLPEWPSILLNNLLPVLLILLARPLSSYFALKMAKESTIEVKERQSNE